MVLGTFATTNSGDEVQTSWSYGKTISVFKESFYYCAWRKMLYFQSGDSFSLLGQYLKLDVIM